MNIQFPINNGQKYYKTHYEFIFRIFKHCNLNIELKRNLLINSSNFKCVIDGKEVIFCFSDDNNSFGIDDPELSKLIVFKFHYGMGTFFGRNVYPFSPISFYCWDEYNEMKNAIRYKGLGIILNNQRAYGGALERRKYVKEILIKEFNDQVDFSLTNQKNYWEKINLALVSVHVPGFCNNMLDRAQLQMMAFGCCTISPYLPEIISYNDEENKPISLQPGIHYIRCRDNYSDLIDIIKWCKTDFGKRKCIEIGDNAKEVFNKFLTPKPLVNYIQYRINEGI